MFTAYVVVASLAAAANAGMAAADLSRSEWVIANMGNVGVPRPWLVPLAILKLAGAFGLLIGIAVPLLGVAAAAGLTLFFVGAIITHIRAGVGGFSFPGTYLVLAVGSLALGLASL